jgi:hypothetical protein
VKVAIITTVKHNVGDDFVRDGIVHLLGRLLGKLDVALIHKHFPLTVRPEWEWLYRLGLTRIMDRVPYVGATRCSRLIDALPLWPRTDKILSAELLVQSGAPVYWLNEKSDSSRNEWYGPLVQRRWQRVHTRVPLLNIGAGACQAYDSDGREFREAPKTLAYIREFHSQCALTTVRDRLSKNIMAIAGVDAPLLPCPSVFARRLYGLEEGKRGFVVLNFMTLAGHYQLDGTIDRTAWLATFVAFARWAAHTERCVLVCHSREELVEAGRLLPEFERFHSTDHRDYLRIYAQASCGVVNRVHAAFAMASFGRPALVIGNDSRARMTEIIGLPNMHVRDATLSRLQTEFEALRSGTSAHAVRLLRLCDDAETAYLRLFGYANAAWMSRR